MPSNCDTSQSQQHQLSDDSSQLNASDSRRSFLKKGSAAAAGLTASMAASPRALRGDEPQDVSKDYVRIGLVGAGGRGGGAINDTLTINDKIRVVSIADLDPAKSAVLRKGLKRYEDKVAIDDSMLFSGIDAYKRVLDDPSIDLVLFATPPAFRPKMVAEAVDAGKHVFAEKNQLALIRRVTKLVFGRTRKQSPTARRS